LDLGLEIERRNSIEKRSKIKIGKIKSGKIKLGKIKKLKIKIKRKYILTKG